jgi:hypothetical protein
MSCTPWLWSQWSFEHSDGVGVIIIIHICFAIGSCRKKTNAGIMDCGITSLR